MRRRGFEVTAVRPEVEQLQMDDWRARTSTGAIQRSILTTRARMFHDAGDLEDAIEQVRPDAVVVDLLAWGALAATEAWGGKWGCWCPFPLPLPSRAGPPPGLGLKPAEGVVGRARDVILGRVLAIGFEHLVGRALGEVRHGLGLQSLNSATELFEKPPLHIYASAEPFEYPRSDWPSSVVMVGPCNWDPPGRPPPQLAAIEEPLVLVTTSTDFQADERLVHIAFEALVDEPVHVVATTPAAPTMPSAGRPGETVLPLVPHSPILSRCVCAITHGGMGSTQKALSHGVPVCAVPFGRDQPDVARRVEIAGAGTRLPARRLSPSRLRKKVREAMRCRPGAQRLAAAFAEAGGPSAAADAIEEGLLSP